MKHKKIALFLPNLYGGGAERVMVNLARGFAERGADVDCGTPVVATNCPSGPKETLDGGRLGRLVPVGDAEALGEAIVQTLNSPVAGESLRDRAGDFTIERAADQYLRLLLGDGAA